MKDIHGSQEIEIVAGRRVIVSAGKGKTNVDDLKWLMTTVLSKVSAWKNIGWAYVADCSEMSPVSPAEGGELVKMTKAFVDAGCKAFGFAEGKSVMLKIQAQKNTERSQTGVDEGHFATVDEALAWIKDTVKL